MFDKLLFLSDMIKEFRKINDQNLFDVIEHEAFILGMREDGVAYFFLKDNMEITVEMQYVFIEAYNKLTSGKEYPIVYVPGANCNVTKEARENAVHMEDLSPVLATAVIAPNSVYQLIANFYFKFNKPKRPYKVFRNVEDAIAWLKPFVLLY